jgi:hypothetical protein
MLAEAVLYALHHGNLAAQRPIKSLQQAVYQLYKQIHPPQFVGFRNLLEFPIFS